MCLENFGATSGPPVNVVSSGSPLPVGEIKVKGETKKVLGYTWPYRMAMG